ncbi:hypothetical protein SAMD00019534_101870 [Acytostelium subglobosum LB1]|uniref:hypothetical protein n=1 Tax=Acytostelium subglobosum LB1 TaxID=1410327 RepID=UPI000645027D|nr:hypothetical protein SAMD00019534_101870 [Acytostelium subglobosum LB1]GAM27012.1 hypothetical protein SAMD00019534_101870 [Acytostelium subglobosum LB1]|eukprot:XP_012749892.1 hypothetical protein SAMD00019534_101870 [Acytostelium subglobosum LB1]
MTSTDSSQQQQQPKTKCSQPLGYVKRSWDELITIIAEGRVHELGRREDWLRRMWAHSDWIKQHYSTARDYILSLVFDFPIVDDGIEALTPIASAAAQESGDVGEPISVTVAAPLKRVVTPDGPMEQRIIIRMNDFPYNIDENIRHCVLWCLHPLTEEQARYHLENTLGLGTYGKEYLVFINPPHLQSIKDVFHYHVFIRIDTGHQFSGIVSTLLSTWKDL